MADRKEATLIVNRTKAKGYGFAHIDGSDRETFIHISDLPGLKSMNDGDRVSLEEGPPDPTKKNRTRASKVIVISSVPQPSTSSVSVPPPEASTPKKPTAPTAVVAPTPPKPKRFEVTVCQLTPDKRNPIRIITKNAKGKPTKGEVQIITGQRFKVDGYTQTFTGDMTVDTNNNGYLDLLVQLLECDTVATFIHTQSAEMTQKSLLKEE